MKNCTHCRHASWNKTAAGKLHPSGDGHCTFPVKIPVLPAAFHWLTTPHPLGGRINRREELRNDCPRYDREPV